MHLKYTRYFCSVILLLVAITLLVACQADNSSDRRSRRRDDDTPRTTTTPRATTTSEDTRLPETTSTTRETAAIDGERVDFEHFSIIVADGYNTLELMGGVQVYQGFNAIEVWVRPSTQSESEALTDAAQMAALYDGTDPESVEYFGYTFYATRLVFAGMDQTIMMCITDGYKIQITLAGSDHDSNSDLLAMFDSIVFQI